MSRVCSILLLKMCRDVSAWFQVRLKMNLTDFWSFVNYTENFLISLETRFSTCSKLLVLEKCAPNKRSSCQNLSSCEIVQHYGGAITHSSFHFLMFGKQYFWMYCSSKNRCQKYCVCSYTFFAARLVDIRKTAYKTSLQRDCLTVLIGSCRLYISRLHRH